MDIHAVIEQLGYSPHEVAVYLAALELSGGTETEIAEKAKLPRTTVESIIESLGKKGLINTYIKEGGKIWAAENPEKLMVTLREHEAALGAVLPKLHSLRRNTEERPTMRAYYGTEEIKQIMGDIIETKHHIFAVSSWDPLVRLLGEPSLGDFVESRRRHYLKLYLLTPKTKLSLDLRQRDAAELRVTHFLPKDIVINNCNFIYGDKIAIISANAKRPCGIVIEDRDFYHAMEVFFQSLWLRSGSTLEDFS